MEKGLTGKVAFVTGGSRGIGAAIARRLAQEGAAVALTYTSGKQAAEAVVNAIQKAGGQALSLQADSGNAEAVKNAIRQTVEALGRLDVLVNNAGVIAVATLEAFSLDDFDKMVAVNIRGVFVASQEAARHMGEGGRIINIGSVNGDRVPFSGGSVYGMTKAAVAGLTRGMARDLGPRGITVNNVQPGPVETDMNPAEGQFAETALSYMAIKRYGQGEEIASLVAYLAGPEAAYVTGASLTIDGGYNA